MALIRTYFDQKGMHMQFNVVDRATLIDAQKHPEKYAHLVVRVAGYSAIVYNTVTFSSGRYHQKNRTGLLRGKL